MERAISEMEKIRRAEEIYSRRRNGSSISSNKNDKTKNKSIYKLLFQLLVLFNIAMLIVAIQNKSYIFTQDFLNQANKYNIDVKSKINEFITYFNDNEILIKSSNNIVKENESVNITEDKAQESNNLNDSNTQNNIVENNNENTVSSLNQMEVDINIIKSKYSLISPVSGIKTSGFGSRSPNKIVTSYHTGIDIANEKGTVIKSSISGIVTQVSSEGDYGKHLRIAVDDLVTLYAHCNKIYVKEGDKIEQGQDIAEIGSTGNSTGNHLHFEIRYENRYIDPEKLLEI